MKAGKIIRSILRWAGRILLLLLALLLGVIVFLFLKELIIRALIRAEYPAPGEMVSIGTHSLHFY